MKDSLSIEEDKSTSTSLVVSSMQKRSKSSSYVQHLPHEILEDILVRLSAQYLSSVIYNVAPSWGALISNPRFVKSHLQRSTIVGFCQIKKNPLLISLTKIDPNAPHTKTTNISLPCNFTLDDRVQVLGSCDGMILLDVSSIILLWNPTTGECASLANSKANPKGLYFYYTGLGYDSSLDEYKAVSLADKHNLFLCRTRTSSSWSKVDEDKDKDVDEFGICSRSRRYVGITLNGSPHWLLNSTPQDSNIIIVYFDMVVEKFMTMAKPSSYLPRDGFTCEITVLDGCLVFTSCPYHHNSPPIFSVWVMKEYGVTESWIKLFVIPRPGLGLSNNDVILQPLGFINNGNIVVLHINQSKMVEYNLKTRNEITIMSNMFPNTSNFLARYTESLVSPIHCTRRKDMDS